MRKLASAAVGLALVLSACGGGGSDDPVEATQDELADVRSAVIDLRLTAAAGTENNRGQEVGLELKGPFQSPRNDGDLPVARMESTRLAGDKRVTSTFISTGKRAFVQVDGKTTELRGSQLAGLRATTRDGADHLGGLHLDRWFESQKATTRGSTTTVTGKLDAPEAINDVFGLAGALGSGREQRRLTGKDADRLRQLVKSSSVELVTGAKDHVLRSLSFDIAFAPENDAEIRTLLPDMSGVGLRFRLALAGVGDPVKVDPPT